MIKVISFVHGLAMTDAPQRAPKTPTRCQINASYDEVMPLGGRDLVSVGQCVAEGGVVELV